MLLTRSSSDGTLLFDDFTIPVPAWVFTVSTPSTLSQALSSAFASAWEPAVIAELDALHAMGTWTWPPTRPPPGAKVVNSRFVFKEKLDEHGNHLRYKARLVAQGFSMVPGLHYNETFAPVVTSASMRLLMLYALQHDLPLELIDFDNAYLYADLEEEIWLRLPAGLPGVPAGGCVRLRKGLYGMPQSGRLWGSHLRERLLSFGLTECTADPCLFVKYNATGDVVAIAGCYVDDVQLAGVPSELTALKDFLREHYKIKELGTTCHLLGVRVDYNREAGTLALSQPAFIDALLRKFDMSSANPVSTPETSAVLASLARGGGEDDTRVRHGLHLQVPVLRRVPAVDCGLYTP